MADEPSNTGADGADDENALHAGALEPLSPQEADNTDYGLLKGNRVQPVDLQ